MRSRTPRRSCSRSVMRATRSPDLNCHPAAGLVFYTDGLIECRSGGCDSTTSSANPGDRPTPRHRVGAGVRLDHRGDARGSLARRRCRSALGRAHLTGPDRNTDDHPSRPED